MRQLISATLRKQGLRVTTASDGERGLAAIRKHHPDLVISDWMMPRLSGPEMIERVRRDESIAHYAGDPADGT